jgi:hypothetical protein
MDEVKGFLTFLDVDRKVAASSQNQAFNALIYTPHRSECDDQAGQKVRWTFRGRHPGIARGHTIGF